MANVHQTKGKRTRGAPVDGKEPPPKKTRIARTHGALENLKNGRPTDYSDELVEVVRIMSRGGATVFEIAQALKVNTVTLYNWAARHEGFFNALYNEGRDAFDARIERTLADRALGYTFEAEKVFSNGSRMSVLEHVPPDIGAAKMWLTNRNPGRWAERQTLDANVNATIKEAPQTPEEKRQLAMEILFLLNQAKDPATHE